MPKPPKRPQVFQSRLNAIGKDLYLGRWPSRRTADIARDRAILYLGVAQPLRHATAAHALGPASPAQLLREASQREKERTSSRFLGVSWDPRGKAWRISTQAHGKRYNVAGLDNEEKAAILRDRLMLYLVGKSAPLNFPTRKLKPVSFEQLQLELRRARSASRYRGVWPQTVGERDTWSAQIIIKRKGHFLGRYATERQAAVAYDRAAIHYLGARAKLNLPAASRRLAAADAATLCAEAHVEVKKTKHSRFHGVTLQGQLWTACIVHRYQPHRLGSFATEEQAATAYDKAAVRLHGSKAKLNFHPVTGEELRGQRLRSV